MKSKSESESTIASQTPVYMMLFSTVDSCAHGNSLLLQKQLCIHYKRSFSYGLLRAFSLPPSRLLFLSQVSDKSPMAAQSFRSAKISEFSNLKANSRPYNIFKNLEMVQMQNVVAWVVEEVMLAVEIGASRIRHSTVPILVRYTLHSGSSILKSYFQCPDQGEQVDGRLEAAAAVTSDRLIEVAPFKTL